jgi:hypothetical protein
MESTNVKGSVKADGTSGIGELTGDDSIYDMVAVGEKLKVTPEVEEQVQRLMGALKTENHTSKFLLEVYFNEERSKFRPFSGFLMAWTNGGFAHGGGDEKVYFCPNVIDVDGQRRRCAAPMPPALIKHRMGICLSCRTPSRDRDLVGEVFFKLPMENWAPVIERYFFRLECNADIRIGIMRGDLMKTTQQEQEREHRGEKLEAVRSSREWVRYNLKDLIKDGASGATLESRLNAFLRA